MLGRLTPAKKATRAVAPAPGGAAYAVTDPVLTGVPPLTTTDRGIDWLTRFDGLFLRQSLQLLEGDYSCGPSSAYAAVPIQWGAEMPDYLTSAYTYPLRAAMDGLPSLTASEVGECRERVCCPLARGFTMSFKDAKGRAFFALERPYTPESCPCWPCLFFKSQQMTITDMNGNIISTTFEPVDIGKACWTRSFVVMDASGAPLYTLRASDCGTQKGCNFMAPSCLNESYDVDVFTPSGMYINSSTFVWPGCGCGSTIDRSNLLIRFPRAATANSRAALVGGMMLVEYTALEVARLKDGSSSVSAASGGIGGGAPSVSEMER